MNQTYRKLWMWGLYALLFLAVMLMQTTVFGRVRFFGVKLNLMPVAVACIAMQAGHEAGGIFGLAAALFWYAAGAEDGTMAMLLFTAIGILAGYLCDNFFAKRLLTALGLCLGALVLHEGCLFLLRFYLGAADWPLLAWVPKTAGLSLLGCPPIYLLAKAIGKAGGNR